MSAVYDYKKFTSLHVKFKGRNTYKRLTSTVQSRRDLYNLQNVNWSNAKHFLFCLHKVLHNNHSMSISDSAELSTYANLANCFTWLARRKFCGQMTCKTLLKSELCIVVFSRVNVCLFHATKKMCCVSYDCLYIYCRQVDGNMMLDCVFFNCYSNPFM